MKTIDKKQAPVQTTAIEVIFWAAALTVVLFVNMSPSALNVINPAFLIVLLVAFLAILSANFLPNISNIKNRIFFSTLVYTIVFFAIFLFFYGATRWLVYYYLPIMIAFVMAFLIIVKPRNSTTVLIAVCTFFLGETFWNIQIGSGKKLFFPPAFLRIYSLTIITIFGYYLYNRELKAQKELTLLNKKLHEADKVKSDFVANVSHELRTPITSIKNACVLLKKMSVTLKSEINNEAFKDVSASELLDIIDFNVDRQSRLIDNLLDLAKLEEGKILARRSLISIPDIAKRVVDSLIMQANIKGVILETDIQPDIQKIYASEDQVTQVFTNLLDNAIKYTPASGKVFLKIISEDHGVKSIITDTGVGIKQEDLEKLFKRFARTEDVLERKAKGTGLGLAITKEILDSHGGRICVESQRGKGSTFTFILPYGLRKNDKD